MNDLYKKFRVKSVKDPYSKTFASPDYDRDIKSMERALKSSLPKGTFYYIGDKQITPDGGLYLDIVTVPQYASVARSSVNTLVSGKTFKGSTTPKYEVSYVSKVGKELTNVVKDAEYAPRREAEKKYLEEQAKLKEKTAKEEERALALKKKQEEKEAERQQKALDRAEKTRLREIAKIEKEQEKARKKRDDEDDEETEPVRFNKGMLLKLVALVTAVVDVARRILSHVMSYAQQSVRDMVTANNLGVSYEYVRQARYMETAHNMKEGTITGSLSDIQTMFGNITTLDENALSAFAVVMGGKIKEMVDMGLGSSDPDKVLGAILDAFNERANAGYNSLGQYVGEAQARRELYSYLNKLSPQIANLFATMQEEMNHISSIWRGKYSDYEGMRKASPDFIGGHNKIDYNVTATLGQEWSVLESSLKIIADSLSVTIAPTVLRLVRWLMNRRVGLSASENAQLNRENRQANESYQKVIDKELYDLNRKENTVGLNAGERDYKKVLENEKLKVASELSKKKEDNVNNVVRTTEELRDSGVAMTQANLINEAKILFNQENSDEYLEAVRRAVNDYLDPSIVAKVRKKQVKGAQKRLEKKKQAEKVALYNELLEGYLKSGMTKDQAIDMIAKEHPELVTVSETTNKKGKVKRKVDYTYKDLTSEEAEEIRKEAEGSVTERMVMQKIANTIRYRSKLHLEDYTLEVARELAQSVPEASLDALYTMDENNPNAWFDKLQRDKAKWLKEYSGFGANVIGYNETNGKGEVIHKIVLDVNGNGLDKEDYVLGSFLGMEGYSGEIGDLRVVYDENGKAHAYINATGKTSSQVQNSMKQGD